MSAACARILIALDGAHVRERLRSDLSRAGHDVRLDTDDLVGLRRPGETFADVVILGLEAPGHDTLEMLTELRRRAPDIIIVALSTGSSIGEGLLLRLARGAGADLAVTEFVAPSALVAAIDELVARS